MSILNWSFQEPFGTSRHFSCIFISGIFIVGGTVNNGFFGFFPAIPFLFLYIYQLSFIKIKYMIIVIVITISICYPLSINHSTNAFLYPYIGSEINIKPGWGRYRKDTRMSMVEVKVSHADLGSQMRVVFVDKNDVVISIDARKLIKDINAGKIDSIDLKGVSRVQSKWTYYLGLLMYWPVLPMVALSMISSK